MIDKLIFDNTSFALEKAASGASRRQEALSQNLANVNTPGYRRRDVSFAESLNGAMANSKFESGEERSRIAQVAAEYIDDPSGPLRMDGNNVDVDAEMAKLAENGIEYSAFVRLLNDKISLMRGVIQGR